GRKEDAARFAASRDEFGADVVAAIERTIRDHGIDNLPGCAEKGDFDATSSTALLEPGGLRLRLPARATRRTFERYAEEIRARAAGAWDLYTPYEWRSVGAMVRLGMKREALETAAFLMDGRRPAAWGQWAEVVRRDPRKAGFVGDMPHAWVGSDFMRAALDLFAYEREDGALVVAAGLPESWARAAGGAGIRGLFVPGGRLSFAASAKSAPAEAACAGETCEDEARVRIEAGLTPPAAGLVVHSPIDGRPLRAFVDGREAPLDADGAVAVRAVPAEVVFVHAAR
ncbi:coagulation factor 5/8 type domain-containing protein, partial [bacterium]|nr:coagulation factor 5/8 type domain-containing protein [bacterium]